MAHQHIGKLTAAPNDHYAIVVARFNEDVTQRLLEGATQALARHGVAEERISVAWVPGAFELPLAAHRMAASGRFAAVLSLGAVIQGETDHHEYINHSVAVALQTAAQKTGVPILFGVLTCRNMEQALARAGGSAGNKGAEAALGAIEMVSVLRQLG